MVAGGHDSLALVFKDEVTVGQRRRNGGGGVEEGRVTTLSNLSCLTMILYKI